MYDVTVYGGARVVVEAAQPSPTGPIPDWAQFVLDVSCLIYGLVSRIDAPPHTCGRTHAFLVHVMDLTVRSERAPRRCHTQLRRGPRYSAYLLASFGTYAMQRPLVYRTRRVTRLVPVYRYARCPRRVSPPCISVQFSTSTVVRHIDSSLSMRQACCVFLISAYIPLIGRQTLATTLKTAYPVFMSPLLSHEDPPHTRASCRRPTGFCYQNVL